MCTPFWLLRPISPYHMIHTPKNRAANPLVIDDFGIQISTSILAAGIYAAVLLGCYLTWLPEYLAIHFDGIRDLSAIYDPTFLTMAFSFVPLGYAAKTFLFTPSMAQKADEAEKEVKDDTKEFDGATATLEETLVHNHLLPRSKRVRTLAKRTAALMTVSSVHTFIHTYGALDGAESIGAAGWSSVWALAALLIGVAFAVIGDV